MARGTPIRTIRLAPILWERLSRIAAERGTTVSDIIREAIVDYLWRINA